MQDLNIQGHMSNLDINAEKSVVYMCGRFWVGVERVIISREVGVLFLLVVIKV